MPSKPLRLCIACRQMSPKSELFRLVKSPEGIISIDHSGKSPGRGAYLCLNESCFKKAIKLKAVSRAFKAQVPENILQSMEGLF
jgi:predicted RNA-binding protein YlxR (DUF448 family)